MPKELSERKRILGSYGEYLLAYVLVNKFGLNVIHADTTGFDLLVADPKGKLTSKKGNIAISVKIRDRTPGQDENVNWDSKKLVEYAKIWDAEPWLGYIRLSKEGTSIFLMDLKTAKRNSGGTKGDSLKYLRIVEDTRIIRLNI